MTRDYIAEMNNYLEENEPTGDVVLAQHAETIVKQLERDDPDLLVGWLTAQAQALIHETIRTRWRSRRHVEQQRRGAFDAAVRTGTVSIFATTRIYLPGKEVWRTLGEMTGDDHLDVAQGYRQREKESQMLAAFHEAVAKELGRRRLTRTVFTEQRYEELMQKMIG